MTGKIEGKQEIKDGDIISIKEVESVNGSAVDL